MSKRPASVKKPPSRKAASVKKQIEIRMYNVGFGDCLLIRLPTDEGERRILVDCGYHTQGKGSFCDRSLVEQIKEDLKGEALHVVIATHRHQDHISGFGERDLWKDVDVHEVWLPFTANPEAVEEEPDLKLWNALMDRLHGLWDQNGVLKAGAAEVLGARGQEEREAAEFMLWNARANAPGIANLLDGLRRRNGKPARRRFLPDDRKRYPSKFETPALPGTSIHVLGPPVEPKLRRNKKVPTSWGFGAEDRDLAPSGEGERPFSSEWAIPEKMNSGMRPFREKTLRAIRLFNDDLFYAASAAESFLNGESLVLVLEFGDARLLLPGDAEVGTWSKIMDNPEALELASSSTFLKVGHHGSHNATPITFIDKHLPAKTPAVVSTQHGAGKFRNGIPLNRLLEKMRGRDMPFARSDLPPKTASRFFKPDPDGRWVDCLIPC